MTGAHPVTVAPLVNMHGPCEKSPPWYNTVILSFDQQNSVKNKHTLFRSFSVNIPHAEMSWYTVPRSNTYIEQSNK